MLVVALVLGVLAGTASASRTAPYWNISGDWLLDFAGGTENREFVSLEQDELGDVEGEFWWINNSGEWEYGGTLKGYVSGHSLYLFYDRTPIIYTGVFEGTINQYGMSGTFVASSGFNTTWSTKGSPISLRKDAPAVAVELLKDADISHRYGDRKSGGNLIADVAHEMGPGSDFRGASKYDTCAYRYEIAMFLNERLEALGIGDRVEVPELQFVLHVTSVNNSTGYQHHFTIYYDVNTGEGYGTGTTSGGAMRETVYEVTLVADVLSFTAKYDNNYTWHPSFTLNGDGTLAFIDGHGTDNVYSATGTWSLTYICK
jgi:hypothetical protein